MKKPTLAAPQDSARNWWYCKNMTDCVKLFEAKYPKAITCLEKDKEALLVFYDFPAEHLGHLRTSNPIESVFATVRLRTTKS